MKYENANDVLPKDLLEQVQKIAGGRLLYIPIAGDKKLWGEKNGNRFRVKMRNREIREKFASGASAGTLSAEYFLTPETIRNIIYEKKEMQSMTFEEICKLYSDEAPISCELKNKLDRQESWAVYMLRDYLITYPSGAITLHIHKYCYTTEKRVQQMTKIIEAYRKAGCDCCGVVPNKYGELSRTVPFEGYDCVVWAEETIDGAIPSSEKSPRIAGEGSRYIYSDEMLALMAKVGEMHLDGSEPNYTVLFDNDSCALKIYEDWIDEYLECDLPSEIGEKQPDLLPLLDKIRKEVKNIRSRLRPIYGKLPKSLFHGEEQRNNQLLSGDGHLIGLCDFNNGGLDTCIAHFLHVAMITTEELPEDYVWLEVNDPDVRQKRLDSLIHSFRVIGKEYNFSEEELAALPLVYKIMLFGGVYYYGTVFELADNHDQLKELLEYILGQLSIDQIDFRRVLAEATN